MNQESEKNPALGAEWERDCQKLADFIKNAGWQGCYFEFVLAQTIREGLIDGLSFR